MRKTKWLAIGILLLACSAGAQETPKAEVSAGYSFLRLGGTGGFSQHGGSFSIAGNVAPWFGLAGDFGFYHSKKFGASLNTKTFMLGPRFSVRSKSKITPFAQAMFGAARLSAGLNGASASVTPFAAGAGGGVDVQLASHVALRTQLDYIAMRYKGQTGNTGRASLGLVFRLGRR